MLSNIVEINEEIMPTKKCDQGVVICLFKKWKLGSLWEIQHVEDSNQTNEGNNEEGKKHLHVCT